MRHRFLVFLFLCSTRYFACANLGETPAQVAARYGQPIKAPRPTEFNTLLYTYRVSDRYIWAEFTEGKECSEGIQAPKSRPNFPDQQCVAIAAAVTGQKNWEAVPSDDDKGMWHSGTNVVASLERRPGKQDILFVQTSAFLALTLGPGGNSLVASLTEPQSPAGRAGNGNGLLQLITNVFNPAKPFSATVDFVLEGENSSKGTAEVFSQDGELRINIDLSKLQIGGMPSDGAGAAALQKLGEFSTLFKKDGSACVLCPNQLAYCTNAEFVRASRLRWTGDTKQVDMGEETVDRHLCRRTEIRLAKQNASQTVATIWRANELDGFPVRLKMPDVIDADFSKVKFGKLDPKLFEVPSTYKAYPSLLEIAQKSVDESSK